MAAKNGEDGEVCSSLCKIAGKVVFITSKGYDGDLGGLAGADDKCNTLAMEAGLANAGNFMAWLSSAEGSPSSRMTKYEEPYLLLDGESIVAASWSELTDGSVDSAINVDETSALQPGKRAWTGTTASGAASSPTCKDWTSEIKEDGGLQGSSSSVDVEWSSKAAASCFTSGRRICVEQCYQARPMRASRSRPMRVLVMKKASATAWVTGAPGSGDGRPCLL